MSAKRFYCGYRQFSVVFDMCYICTTYYAGSSSGLKSKAIKAIHLDSDKIKQIQVRWLDPNLIKYSKRVFEIQNLNAKAKYLALIKLRAKFLSSK